MQPGTQLAETVATTRKKITADYRGREEYGGENRATHCSLPQNYSEQRLDGSTI